jgi:hypothetical protein
VKPARSVTLAFSAPLSAASAAECISVEPGFESAKSARCVCMSIRPGSTVSADQSITSEPAGGGDQRSTATTRSPSIAMRWSVSTLPLTVSTSRPAWT